MIQTSKISVEFDTSNNARYVYVVYIKSKESIKLWHSAFRTRTLAMSFFSYAIVGEYKMVGQGTADCRWEADLKPDAELGGYGLSIHQLLI